MTVFTLCLRDLEYGVFTLRAFRQVTLVATNGQVATFEWIFCCCMILDREGGRFPAVDGMARGTFAAIGTTAELPFVRILVAVHALRKWDGRLKVPVGMTLAARNRGVFVEQREFCL